MSDWEIGFELIDKPISKDKNINRTAKFKQMKWRRDSFRSEMLYM